MKKTIYYLLVVLMFLGSNVKAESPTASTKVYDFDNFGFMDMLELFYQAKQEGRNYPTKEQIRNKFGYDMEFARSHTKLAPTIKNQATQVDPNINPERKLWMNVPLGTGSPNGGYPSSNWNDDTYTGWNYTYLMGAWNHTFFQVPGCNVSAAHKHGTSMLSGMKFFDTAAAKTEWLAKIMVKEGSEYKYAEPLINLLMYMGSDGINYNWEPSSGYNGADLLAFHKRLHQFAQEKNFTNFYTGFYTNISELGTSLKNNYYSTDGVPVFNALMLNYTRTQGDFPTSTSVATTVNNAKTYNPNGTTDGVYVSGWIVTLKKDWPALSGTVQNQANICLWGEHGKCRLWDFARGEWDYGVQEDYQERTDRFFSGGNRNPANRPTPITGNTAPIASWDPDGTTPAMHNFHGLSTFIAERSAIIGKLPFVTNFTLGNGPRYHYKGKKTFNEWYNMGNQDYQPTYRWLVYEANTKTVSTAIQPKFTHMDAYTGGSVIELNGQVTQTGTDIILYRTELEVSSSNPTATVAFKMVEKPAGTPTNLSLILKTNKSGDGWMEYSIGNIRQFAWDAVSFPISGLSTGDTIKQIGFRVKGEESAYSIYLGELKLMDDRKVSVEAPVNVMAEVKEETTSSMTVKMNWEMNAMAGVTPERQDFGLIYNHEVNVDHFEIFYKNGENGDVKLVGKSNTWSHLIGKIRFADDEVAGTYEDPYVGVRAVSVDLQTYSEPVWIQVHRADPLDLPTKVIDTYCESNCPGASSNNVRWLKSVTTTGAEVNLNYSASAPVSDGSNYVNYTHRPMTARQGSTFEFKFVGYNSGTGDGLRYCFANAYVDWDGNGAFIPSTGELVFSLGTPSAATAALEAPAGVTQSFTVPENATPGPTRLRLVFQDAWVSQFSPCGATTKGFTIDFTVNIVGDNPGNPAKDYRDTGAPEEPEKIHTGMDKYIYTPGASRFYPNPAKDIIYFDNTDKVMVYSVNGSLVHVQDGGVTTMNVANLSKGVYIVKMVSGSVIRNQKLIKE